MAASAMSPGIVTDIFSESLHHFETASPPQSTLNTEAPNAPERHRLQSGAANANDPAVVPPHAAIFEDDEALKSSVHRIYDILDKLRKRYVLANDDLSGQTPFNRDDVQDQELDNCISRLSMITVLIGSMLVKADLKRPNELSRLLGVMQAPPHRQQKPRRRSSVDYYTAALNALVGDIHDAGLAASSSCKALAMAANYLLKALTENIFISHSPELEDKDINEAWSYLSNRQSLRSSIAEIVRFTDQIDARPQLSPGCAYDDWLTVADLKVIEQDTKLLYDMTMQSSSVRDVLKDYIKTPAYRSKFSSKLTAELKKRIRPDTPTVEVLEEFLSLLSVLRLVDPTGIVLHSPMKYVRDNLQKRGDAVQIIAASMLEPFDTDRRSGGLYCNPIAEAIHSLSAKNYQTYYEGSDLTDPNWLPDPIDAQRGYRQGVYMDQVTHLLGLQPQEQFAEILQGMMAKNLIASEGYKFEMELQLLATLKPRMNEELVKRFEVMIQDALKSRDINLNITQSATAIPDVQAKVLSYRFWPEFHEVEFSPPAVIEHALKVYGDNYRKLKEGRRLEWFSGASSTDVELSIGNESIVERVTPFQAAVISLFSDEESTVVPDDRDKKRLSLSRMKQLLFPKGSGDDDKIQEATEFWVNKGVLKQVNDNTWAASENLTTDAAHDTMVTSHEQTTGPEPEQQPQLQTALDAIIANEEVYANFITHMLRNQGAMAAARVLQFMKMLLPGGFPFQEPDLVEFLNILQERGTIERNGANWRIPPNR